MTFFELVVRSMRKNVKQDYLYFVALIFSTSLYFIFATLQYDPSIKSMSGTDLNFAAAFKVAGILLLCIVAVFTVYANSIFLKRRSKEIGLYQLIGLSRRGVVRFLITENLLLGVGALLVGILCGAALSRLFLLILLKILGFDGMVGLKFSMAAAAQTAIVFTLLVLITSVQMGRSVYRSTLLELFYAEKQAEHPQKPGGFRAAFLALFGIALMVAGYVLSGHMFNQMLFLNMLLVLLTTIVGTYLLFRVTISWLLYRYRKSRQGHLGLKNSLSLAPLMHRMKGNANSLTLITVLSAMTLTMVALAYSLYYSAGSDTRIALPYDMVFENDEPASSSFRGDLQKAGIDFVYKPIKGFRGLGEIRDQAHPKTSGTQGLLFLPAEQLRETGADIPILSADEALLFDGRARLNRLGNRDDRNEPKEIVLRIKETSQGESKILKLTESVDKFAMNYNVYGDQMIVKESVVQELREKKGSISKGEEVTLGTYRIPNHAQRAKASALYAKYVTKDDFKPDYESQYREALKSFGLYIFISGFLGLVFLVSTGSILYFKQIAEAEEEKRSFLTLRQLGFDVKDIMSGIVRKQLFVFAIPLLIGLLHSIFAVKAASVLVLSNIVVPSAIAMGVYGLIYFMFGALTILHYRKLVKSVMYKPI
ncbi:ABC transporter permease [Paenibacillus sp. CAA11]|nr:ABC transporter permease [Paenibacillus sp. CAA11]